MQCILDKFNMLANSKGTKDSRKANSASQEHGKNKKNKKKKDKDKDKRNANSTNTNNTHKKITYEMTKATPCCVESDVWRTMIKDQQQVVWDKVQKHYNMPVGQKKDSTDKKDSKVKFGENSTRYIKSAASRENDL